MTERASLNHEQDITGPEIITPDAEREHASHEQEARHELKEKVDDIREKAAEIAEKAEDVLDKAREDEPEEKPVNLSGVIKKDKYRQTLNSIRKDLPAVDRAFSKVIHNKVVESASELGSKTVARPSGVLFAGIFAFLGSSVFLWVAKHYGYEYNFIVFLLFLVGGFVLGLILEMIYRIFKKAPRN